MEYPIKHVIPFLVLVVSLHNHLPKMIRGNKQNKNVRKTKKYTTTFNNPTQPSSVSGS